MNFKNLVHVFFVLVISLAIRFLLFSQLTVSPRVVAALSVGFGVYFLIGVFDVLKNKRIYLSFVEMQASSLTDFENKSNKKYLRNILIAIVFTGWVLNGIADENTANIVSIIFYTSVSGTLFSIVEIIRFALIELFVWLGSG